MGWLLVRPDGSVKTWNRVAQDDAAAAGEVWVAHEDTELLRGNLLGLHWDGKALGQVSLPPVQKELDRADALAKLDAAALSGSASDIKAALAAIRKVL